MSELTFLTTPAVPSHVVAAHLGAIMWVVRHRLVPVMHTTLHALSAANEKEKERNSYTFRRQLSEKASVIPICPESAANAHMAPHAKHLCCMELIRIRSDAVQTILHGSCWGNCSARLALMALTGMFSMF